MRRCKKCGAEPCCDYSYGCWDCAQDDAFEKGRASMEAKIAELEKIRDLAQEVARTRKALEDGLPSAHRNDYTKCVVADMASHKALAKALEGNTNER